MKILITIFIMSVAVGCVCKTFFRVMSGNRLSLQELKEQDEKELVGTYEAKKREDTFKLVLIENGKLMGYLNGEKDKKGTWKLVEKEVHIEEVDIEEVTDILKIESNGNLTSIALIEDRKRTDFPKDEQITFKRIK